MQYMYLYLYLPRHTLEQVRPFSKKPKMKKIREIKKKTSRPLSLLARDSF